MRIREKSPTVSLSNGLCRRWSSAWAAALLAAVAAGAARAAETEGVHCSTITDQDGDEVVLMESEWISMHLLPRMQAIINRFVFRPTGNDIVELLTPKIRMLGGGILMDCLWEQDWRFQELKEKPYPYKITKSGPEEAQVTFETDIIGWVGADKSGLISKLLSNLILRRTVTLKSGQPFFRFDFEFTTKDGQAKRPTFWVHNSSAITPEGEETVSRPSARGVKHMRGPFGTDVGGEHYIRDFDQGWSARICRDRKEGIVYLMDYDYTQWLYNCGTTTEEWMYDSILALANTPWKGRVYILPIIGLSGVDYANEYFICQMEPKRQDGRLTLSFHVTSSYEKVAQVTFNTTVEYGLLDARPQTLKLAPVTVEGIGLQPTTGRAGVELAASDPLALAVTAYVELPDRTMKKYEFYGYYSGEYDSGQGENVGRNMKPVKTFPRRIPKPAVPPVPAGMAIRRGDLKVFGIFGLGTMRLGLDEAVRSIPGASLEVGYCCGRGSALTDFPYDYERLFACRAMLLSNTQDIEFRRIGAEILMPWLKAGGGLVISGGENAFDYSLPEHAINDYYPYEVQPQNLRRGLHRLQPPDAKEHPIFRDIDLADLPYLYYVHDVKLKGDEGIRMLMRVGDKPFLVEKRNGNQITMAVFVNHFGTPADFDNKPHVRHWPQWPKLYANIVRYAAQDLK